MIKKLYSNEMVTVGKNAQKELLRPNITHFGSQKAKKEWTKIANFEFEKHYMGPEQQTFFL